MSTSIPEALNTLSAGLILISAFAMVATRQVQGVLRFFVAQSVLLAGSSFLLAYSRASVHLWALGAITIVAKVLAIPWVLRRLLPAEFYERREISQAVNIPTSLLLALMLTIVAEVLMGPIVAVTHDPVIRVNLPIGLAGILIGAYSLVARREAIPQLIGILAMENGAFFAGVAIAPELPLIAELAVAVDVVLIAVVVGLLTRNIRETVGTTEAAALDELKRKRLHDADRNPRASSTGGAPEFDTASPPLCFGYHDCVYVGLLCASSVCFLSSDRARAGCCPSGLV
jgi:hydrogenase-4 component E